VSLSSTGTVTTSPTRTTAVSEAVTGTCASPEVMGTTSGADDLLGDSLTRLVVGDDLDFTWLVLRVHPHQAVALLTGEGLLALLVLRSIDGDAGILLLATLALAVDEELGLGMVGVHEDRGYLSFAPRPRPVGEDVKRLSVLVPVAAVEIEAVLGDTCQVDSTEERGVAGPFAVVGGRLTEVIDTRPDEFAHAPVMIFLTDEVVLGQPAGTQPLLVDAPRGADPPG